MFKLKLYEKGNKKPIFAKKCKDLKEIHNAIKRIDKKYD
jgi:hypothetical protein